MTINISDKLPSGGPFPWFNTINKFTSYVTGRYYPPDFPAIGYSAQAVTAGRLYFVPFFVRSNTNITIDRLGWFHNSSAGNVRVGVYNADSNGKPSSLLVDAGAAASSAGALNTVTLSQALTARTLYHFAFITDGGISVAVFSPSTAGLHATMLPERGIDPLLLANPNAIFMQTIAYGALPDPAVPDTYEPTKLVVVYTRIA